MADKKSKIGVDQLTEETRQVVRVTLNPEAQAFVREAADAIESERILIVEDRLDGRLTVCRPQMQLYVLHPIADWIEDHANGGKGGTQILMNYLLARGIEAVEKDAEQKGGMLYVTKGWLQKLKFRRRHE